MINLKPEILEELQKLGYTVGNVASKNGLRLDNEGFPGVFVRSPRPRYDKQWTGDKFVLCLSYNITSKLEKDVTSQYRINCGATKWKSHLMAAHTAACFAAETAKSKIDEEKAAEKQRVRARIESVGQWLGRVGAYDINPENFCDLFMPIITMGDVSSVAVNRHAARCLQNWINCDSPERVQKIIRLYRLLEADWTKS